MSIFSKMVLRKPKKSVHNLSYSSKFSMSFGDLIPIYCEKVVPGDKFKHGQEFYMRFAPFVNQVFQEFIVNTDYFFIPSRIIWKNFEKFISEPDSLLLHPFFDYGRVYNLSNNNYINVGLINSIFDYFNLPTQPNQDSTVSNPDGFDPKSLYIDILPFLAYIQIFLQYYVDENLGFANYINQSGSLFDFKGTGDNSVYLRNLFFDIHNILGDVQISEENLHNLFRPFKRMYPKDYFTSALPTAQFGPPVSIPLDGSGIVNITTNQGMERYHNVAMTHDANGKVTLFANPVVQTSSTSSNDPLSSIKGDGSFLFENDANITFSVDNIEGNATVKDLRTATVIQQFLEKRGYAGHRYKEVIKASFGVNSLDSRLDRPEFIQRNRNIVNLGDVFTTSFDSNNSVPGMSVTTAKAATSAKQWSRHIEEHGYIIGLMSVYPKASYFEGIPKQFTELDIYDYFWPEFQHIGEQEISKMELNASRFHSETFGYTPRYSQYKSRYNQIHGDFRNSLSFMHAGRMFGNRYLELNDNFLTVSPEINNLNRVFNATSSLSDYQPIYVDLFHNVRALRPMDYYGLPKFL